LRGSLGFSRSVGRGREGVGRGGGEWIFIPFFNKHGHF
jgi:hypothetical protein